MIPQVSNVLQTLSSRYFGLGAPHPVMLYLDVTFGCNLSCRTCAVGFEEEKRKHQKELGTDELKKVLDSAKSFGFYLVSFGGGEPLTRQDIPELIEYSSQLGFVTHINTNGVLIDQVMAEKLGKAGLEIAAVSLDGSKPKTHDWIRGAGNFEKAINGIENLKKYSPKTKLWLNYTVGRHNLNELFSFPDFAMDLGAEKVKFTPVATNLQHRVHPTEYFDKIKLTKEDFDQVQARVKEVLTHFEGKKILGNSEAFLIGMANRLKAPIPKRCLAGYLFTTINSVGELFPCYDYPGELNVRKAPLDILLQSKEYKRLCQQVNLCDRDCWDVGSAEPSLLIDPGNIRGKLRMIASVVKELF